MKYRGYLKALANVFLVGGEIVRVGSTSWLSEGHLGIMFKGRDDDTEANLKCHLRATDGAKFCSQPRRSGCLFKVVGPVGGRRATKYHVRRLRLVCDSLRRLPV